MKFTCSTLSCLPLSSGAMDLLGRIHKEGEPQILKIASEYLLSEIGKVNLQTARDLQNQARLLAGPEGRHQQLLDQFWVLARACEIVVSANNRPFCKHCYKTVALKKNGKTKEFCPDHASDPEATNRGGYLRGYRFSAEFAERVSSENFITLTDELEFKFLRHQLFSTRKGVGAAGNVVLPAVITDSIWTQGTGLSIEELRLNEICDDYPDWTEVARRWRELFDDKEGAQELGSQDHAVTPRLLVTQWLRWHIWMHSGDKNARVGKGRPPKIDQVIALDLKEHGKTHAQIADHFGVSKAAVAMFFTRLKAKNTEHT